MGDVGRGMFVRPGIPEFMREQVVPAADVVTPNHFELDFLTGRSSRTLEELLAAVGRGARRRAVGGAGDQRGHRRHPGGLARPGGGVRQGAWRTRTPRLGISPNGAGDLTAAVFLANLLDEHPLDLALARTTSSVFAVIDATAAAGARELRIVESQDRLADPPLEFAPERLR